jgi:hypothetical protein
VFDDPSPQLAHNNAPVIGTTRSHSPRRRMFANPVRTKFVVVYQRMDATAHTRVAGVANFEPLSDFAMLVAFPPLPVLG